MPTPDLVIRGRRIVTGDGVRPAAIHLHNGRIVGVLDFGETSAHCPVDDAGDAFVMPGAIELHKRVDDAEDLIRATQAAAAGGVTTMMAAPSRASLTSVAALDALRTAADGRCHVDVGFWGRASPEASPEANPDVVQAFRPASAQDLRALFDAGVCGFDGSLRASADAPALAEDDLKRIMPGVAHLDALFAVHAEFAPAPSALAWWRDRSYARYLEARPKSLENEAIDLMIRCCRDCRTRTHLVDLSSSGALTPLFRARTERLPISADTSVHHLFFAAEDISGAGRAFRSPGAPIRGRENRELLWAAVANGLVGSVGAGDLTPIELGLAVTWTAASGRGYGVDHLAAWMCRMPARVAGLSRKGTIDVGYDGDLVVFDPDAEFTAEAAPYSGRRLRGVVRRTYLRGVAVYLHESGWTSAGPRGRLLVARSGWR